MNAAKAIRTTLIASRKFEGSENCLEDAARDFASRRHIAKWRVSAEWADDQREEILITY